jgi:hypothetical protein
VGWSHKYGEVLEAFGLDRYAADHSASPQEVCALLDELIENSTAVRRRIAGVLPEVQGSSLGQFDLVEQMLA